MAPLSHVMKASFKEKRGDVTIYSGEVSNVWTIIAIPQGGYALGLLVEACQKVQADTPHIEIMHVTSHFLRTTAILPFEVHIRPLRIGKGYANLTADLIQQGEVKITALLIFRTRDVPNGDPSMTLSPPSPFARRIPLYFHPAVAPITSMFEKASFKKYLRWAQDKTFHQRNYEMEGGVVHGPGGGTLEWGAWIELIDPSERIVPSMLPFFGDMMQNLPHLLPKAHRPPLGWFPTMVLSVEYKAEIPDDPAISKRTIGLYSRSSFMNAGRHDVYVEIWTAPSNLGEGVETEGWRDKQVCLGIASQTALNVPSDVNLRKAQKANSKL
ncbi:hypothetical protein M422DRAFT_70107 [Sphaerobolus stellatus SS14]|uniref:Acyl-CoA thioesterase-like N-terminal HotDog domain-containing protein n=1 Tax=Sphaerobolus stellatus (strain SS14) TaxID=990650 RepID=A0A0C9TWV2_SPHS4|nr:hypothetical protein M422DRAFT_70107 [Sphaerobolus stellatus SS14]